MPAAWGLKGKSREIAEAEYNLTGYDLDEKLIEINFRDDAKAKHKAIVELQHKYLMISQREYQTEMANLLESDVDRECELLRIKYAHSEISEYDYRIGVVHLQKQEGQDRLLAILEVQLMLDVITQREFDKQRATALNEPYICVIDSGYKPEEKLNGLYFEFDWNDLWIDELKSAGYTGFTDDQLVQRWFSDICRGVIAEDDTVDGQPIPFNSSRIINQVRRDGGPTEYS